MLQVNKNINKQVINSGEIIGDTVYLIITKSNKNWYREEYRNKDSVIISTSTIIHPCLDFATIKYVEDLPHSLCKIITHKELFKGIQFVSMINIMTTF